MPPSLQSTAIADSCDTIDTVTQGNCARCSPSMQCAIVGMGGGQRWQRQGSSRRWSNKSSSACARTRGSGWSVAASLRTIRLTRWRARPRFTCPSSARRRTSRAMRWRRTRISPSLMTLKQGPLASAHGQPPGPGAVQAACSNGRMREHTHATEDCCECPYAAWPRSDL